VKVTVLYIGSSLLAPLKQAEREINRQYDLDLKLAAYNFGAPLTDDEWSDIERDLKRSDVVFAIHVMDGENATRLIAALERNKQTHRAVIVINCMPDLMRRTRMGRLDAGRLFQSAAEEGETGKNGDGAKNGSSRALRLFGTAGSWVGRQVRAGRSNGKTQTCGHTQYLKLIDRLPGILRFVPSAGALRDVKNYLNIFCYFLQPTPANIRSMVLYALKEYAPDERLKNAKIEASPPESMPSVAIYHPDATHLFESFSEYRKWYTNRGPRSQVSSPKSKNQSLDSESTIGLLLMRPQVVSKTTRHYDALIRAIEAEGLSVIPALSTLMDNREACQKFFV
jgi:magnesium chelatase subunit H